MINWYTVGGILAFYLLILIIGLYAAWRGKRKMQGGEMTEENMMLAGRDIGLLLGCFTMTATWVGGGYINGTAEYVYSYGILQTQAPVGYSLSLFLGGLFFAKKMRKAGYITLIDPFQLKYGERIGGLLYIPALLGEVFWSGAILNALGASVSVVLGLDNTMSIIISASIAVCYTLLGGLLSVAYTDVIQLVCIMVGLVITVPFAWSNEAVGDIGQTSDQWIGTIHPKKAAKYVDSFLLLMFGGIPWQVYFQRVLSSSSAKNAQILSFVAALGCVINAIPPLLIGVIATATDPAVANFTGQESEVLPLVIDRLTPEWVAAIGLGAVSAAVMSSSDSSILSASSMFARNIYNMVIRQNASDRELRWVIRVAIVVIGTIAAVLAINVTSVYVLFYLCSDLVYVILFPQLCCVLYFTKSNSYGSIAGYLIGLILRIGGGEPEFNLDPFIYYWHYDANDGQLFPFKSFAMLCSFLSIVLVSLLTDFLFHRQILPKSADVLRCVVNERSDENALLKKSGSFGGESNPALSTVATADYELEQRDRELRGEAGSRRTNVARRL